MPESGMPVVTRSNRTLIFLVGIVATILLGWVLHVGAGILQPFVIALLLASMLQPVVRFLARLGIPPVLTVVFLVVLLFLGFARLGMLVQSNLETLLRPSEPVAARVEPGPQEQGGPAGAEETPPEPGAEETDEVAGAAQDPGLPTGGLTGMLEEQERISEQAGGFESLVGRIVAQVQETSMPPRVRDYVVRALYDIDLERIAPDLVGSSFSFTRGLLLVLIYMLFIFAEQAVFRRKILSIAGKRRNDAAEVLDTIGRGIQRYLGVKTIVSLVTGSICYAALAILQVPFAALWGFLTFALNYIPTFGSIIAGCFPTIYTAFAPEGSWGKAMLIIAIYLAVNITLGSIIEPRILGRELNLSPLVVVLSVVVWAGVWGVVGSFLAVPLTSILQIVLASQETTRPIAVMLSSGKGLEAERTRPPPARDEIQETQPPAANRCEKTA